ncbi:MAG: hypothetical protein RLZZ511_4066 [Cyanobacteriota bacterium]
MLSLEAYALLMCYSTMKPFQGLKLRNPYLTSFTPKLVRQRIQ